MSLSTNEFIYLSFIQSQKFDVRYSIRTRTRTYEYCLLESKIENAHLCLEGECLRRCGSVNRARGRRRRDPRGHSRCWRPAVCAARLRRSRRTRRLWRAHSGGLHHEIGATQNAMATDSDRDAAA